MTGAAADDEPPAEPRVDRIEKADGRYILYFSWPADPPSTTGERRGVDEGRGGE
jgi:hypothetical protein